jgi:hypothetical protein
MNSKFYYFGPLLYHTKLNDTEVNNLKSLCIKDGKNSMRHRLAGHISEEYAIDSDLFKINIKNYLIDFKNCYNNFYNDNSNKKINLSDAWVNYMKPGEYNPAHIHSADFSGVVYLNFPIELQNEIKEHQQNNIQSLPPGGIHFLYSCPQEYFITQNIFVPNIGEMFIFPSKLMHMVPTFKSKVERISIAFNIKFYE